MKRLLIKYIPFIVVATIVSPGWALAQQDTFIDAQKVYDKSCYVCHGEKGSGAALAMETLVPPPRNLTAPDVAIKLTDKEMFDAIKNGRPGTAMVSWKSRLSDERISSLVKLIREKFMRSSRSEHATAGQALYHRNCSVCHGDKGDGKTAAAAGLSRKPRDFTSEKVRKELTRDRMIFVANFGIPNSPMVGFKGRLTDKELTTIVDYIRVSFVQPKVIAAPGGQAHGDTAISVSKDQIVGTPEYMKKPMPKSLVGDYKKGKLFYNKNCALCHGEKGDGDGPRAYFINPKPRNFQHPASRKTLNRPTLHTHIGEGILRTEMPAWNKVLSEQQIADVAEYVFRVFIDPDNNYPHVVN